MHPDNHAESAEQRSTENTTQRSADDGGFAFRGGAEVGCGGGGGAYLRGGEGRWRACADGCAEDYLCSCVCGRSCRGCGGSASRGGLELEGADGVSCYARGGGVGAAVCVVVDGAAAVDAEVAGLDVPGEDFVEAGETVVFCVGVSREKMAGVDWIGFKWGGKLREHIVPSGHIFGQPESVPVGSVQPSCQIVPTNPPFVAIHRPLSKQTSTEPAGLCMAQHPLCFASGLQGPYSSLSCVPSRP